MVIETKRSSERLSQEEKDTSIKFAPKTGRFFIKKKLSIFGAILFINQKIKINNL